MFLFGPCFSMKTTPRKPSNCLDLKNQGKKSAKTRKLGFLRKDCAQGGEESRKPTKTQGEIQGSRKPSVLVGFLRQRKGLCIHPPGGPLALSFADFPTVIKNKDFLHATLQYQGCIRDIFIYFIQSSLKNQAD